MTGRRLGLASLGFVVGGLLGGFCHLLLLDRPVMKAYNQSDLDPLYFGVKIIGETFAVLFFLYGFWLFVALFATLIYAFTRCITAIQRGRKGSPRPQSRSWPLARLPFLFGALLGMVASGAWNLKVMTDTYASAIANNDRYAIATASAVPAMRALTAIYCGIFIALAIVIALTWGFRQMRRVTIQAAS